MGRLKNKVALVTGASRGIGRGIALALAEQGATVYVTGRTVQAGSYILPGTVGETAAQCDARGGRGIAVQVDHADASQVASLFEQIRRDSGQLDILVNNAFALPEDLTDTGGFWEKPLSNLQMIDVGVTSNFTAAWHAAQLMVPAGQGLMVTISGYAGGTYNYGALFGTCKSAADRMAHDMAIELKPHGVVSLSLWLGLTFTERASRNLAANPAMSSHVVTNPAAGSTVEFPGRVICALASDPQAIAWTGGTLIAAELAEHYEIRDIDGNAPPSLRHQRRPPIWDPIGEAI